MQDLFDKKFEENLKKQAPLADRIRPEDFEEFFGQNELVGPDSPLRRAVQDDNLASLIFWGPPGCGKTTLARIIARKTKAHFVKFSAVNTSINDVRKAIKQARERRKFHNKGTILFSSHDHQLVHTVANRIIEITPLGYIDTAGTTYDEYLADKKIAEKRHGLYK